MLHQMKNPGGVQNKNILFFLKETASQYDHTDGLRVVIQLLKVLIIAQQEAMLLLVVLLQMLTTKLVCTLESKFLEPMQRLCLVNGNIKSVLVKESKLVTTCGFLDSFFIVLQKNLNLLSVLNLSFSLTGTDQDVTPTFQQKK